MSLLTARSALAQADECLVAFKGAPATGGTVTCDECNQACDSDGVSTPNGKCVFRIAVCGNLADGSCTAADLKKIKVKGKKASGLRVTPNGTSSVCGAFVNYEVKLKKKGKKAGKAKIKASASGGTPKRKDKDVLTLICTPQTASACPTTTTTTVSTTTTTTAVPCGNGTVGSGEQCDPPGGQAQCTAGQVCNNSCQCVAECTNACAPTRIVTTSGAGLLAVSTLAPFPFPAGVNTTIDVGTADTNCKHGALVPAGGFTVPVFCIPALGFTSSVTATGCASGGNDGNGSVWDATSPAPTPNVSRVGDTSDPSTNNCGTLGTDCTLPADNAGSAGNDTKGNIDTTRGAASAEPPAAGVHTQLDIPVHSLTWNDNDGNCPDEDGVFDAGTDTLVTDFNFILSPTTGTSNADYTDLNGDNCSFEGNGPDHVKHCSGDVTRPCATNSACNTPPAGTCVDGAIKGIPPAGPCCTVGQTTTVVASGIAFTGGSPLYDLIFANQTPATITACDPPNPTGTCTLTNDACQD